MSEFLPPARVRAILRLAQPSTRRFLPGLAAGVASALSAVALLATSAWLITRAAEQPPILYLSMAIVGVRAFALGRSAFRYLDRLTSHDAAFRQLAALRVGVFERILPLAPAGLANTRRGDLLTRLVRDVDDLQDFPLRVVQPLATAGMLAVVSVVGVWLLSPLAALGLALCLVLAGVLGTAASGSVAAGSERELAPLRGDLADRVLELVENIDVLTAFGVLDARLEGLAGADDRLRLATLRRSVGVGIQGAVLSLFAGAATVAALLAGFGGLSGGSLPGPDFAVIVLVPMAVFEIFAVVPAALGAWRQVRSSAQRVADAVPTTVPREIPIESDADSGRDAVAAMSAQPVLLLRGVGASWPGATEPGVSGVTLRLGPGERVHLAGQSGAGKTTLAQVLVRFLDYTGSYTLDGVEANTLAPSAVRRVVGLCEQQPWLFDDSIRQNLLFARETASDDDLLAVLDRVGLGDWTAQRGGLDARVGERGALVSGGQAQRIALARALLADFPVLVVDEPTANVDEAQGDRLVRDILATAAEDGRAVLLISHTPVPDELITARVTLPA
ncbi:MULTISPECIES: thiol reductant ABC exporter subunit CydC [unclassified Cryobacterium]|uniref:thiol reductant ABC exporter subunit CydC n=1 Tax=unclassified Cryobacterium TaxID=2649013 RepID=UPI002AB52C1E|nr:MULTISPECIES: thiol reductant ABC exporter subunit CydC [unclassified Cryobacterium]MDY7527575.1 thiol reductant ABC exporter subunit CydC [Cryobacterium sp. 10C2]MEB0001644.1 thiol reductant ABC exporter subunit CydC [Cryobacterium sp. RTC2.1]MEB0201964.1 thiol reductant ABC exporter subunit CydC [Cryobacterium sp. 5I3]MEB0286912.1 thiol reductant ABC exporter subunit CydC [Cryobacterium sp. 10S3]MEB0291562.1 thiol reductant ABC exporter subunit CydC [Cryobacterium sp. 10C2]